jgi:type I restriction enzyme R subunit
VKGAMLPKEDELPRLQSRHAAALRFFGRIKNKDDLNQCVAVLAPEDVRAEFDVAFKRFSQSLDMMLPDPRALPYVDDMRWLGKIRQAASARYRDETLDISDCGAKVRKLIEEAIAAEGIQILVQQVALFSKEFNAKLAALKSPEARASEMEHAIRHEIHVRLEENPTFYQSLRERLEQIIEDRKQRRIDAAKQLELYAALTKELKGEAEAADQIGLSETAFAIYGLLQGDVPRVAESGAPRYNEANKELASLLEEAVEPHTEIVDWTQKDDVQREMRRQIKRQLKAAQFPAEKMEPVTAGILDLVKVRKGR